jgi:hypothetical protein
MDDQHSPRCYVYEMDVIACTTMHALKRLNVFGRLKPMVDAQTGLRTSVDDSVHKTKLAH